MKTKSLFYEFSIFGLSGYQLKVMKNFYEEKNNVKLVLNFKENSPYEDILKIRAFWLCHHKEFPKENENNETKN